MVIQRSNQQRRPLPVVPTNVAPVIGGIAPQRAPQQPQGLQPTGPALYQPPSPGAVQGAAQRASPMLPQRNAAALGTGGPGRIPEPPRAAVNAHTPLSPAFRGAPAFAPGGAAPGFNPEQGMAPPGYRLPSVPGGAQWGTYDPRYNASNTARGAWGSNHLQDAESGGMWSHGAGGVQPTMAPSYGPVPNATPVPYIGEFRLPGPEGAAFHTSNAGVFNDLAPPQQILPEASRGAQPLPRFEDAWRASVGPLAGSVGAAPRTVSAPVRERREAPAGVGVAPGATEGRADASTDERVRGASTGQTNVPLGSTMNISDVWEGMGTYGYQPGDGWSDTGKEINGNAVWRDAYGQDWMLQGDDFDGTLTRVDSRRGYDPTTGDPYVGWDKYGRPGSPREGEEFTNQDNGISWTYLNGQWHQTKQLPKEDQIGEAERNRRAWIEQRTQQIAAERARVEGSYKAEQLDPAALERVLQAQRARSSLATARGARMQAYAGSAGIDPSVTAAITAGLMQQQVLGDASTEAQLRYEADVQNLQLRVQMNNQKLAALLPLAQQDIQTQDTALAAGEAERIRIENQDLQLQMAQMGAEAQARQADASMWSSLAGAGGALLGGLLGIFGGPPGIAAGAAIGGAAGAGAGAIGSNLGSSTYDATQAAMAAQRAGVRNGYNGYSW